MSGMIRKGVLFLGVTLSSGLFAQAPKPAVAMHGADVDVAITYVAERAKIASINCGCFWLYGGSGDFALTFSHGMGVAANLTGAHASQITPGIDLDKVMFAIGPRYTYNPGGWANRRGAAVFGEALFGGVHEFNTIVPSANGSVGAASSFAMMFGGGLDLRVARHIRIRAVEADYVRSTLPNNASSVQNDLRLASGVSFHFSGAH